LILDKDHLVLRDLGSRNGTLLNSAQVKGETEVHAGDQIGIGPILLTVVGSVSDATPAFAESSSTGRFVDASIDDISDYSNQFKRDRLLAALYEAGQMLARRMDPEEVYEAVLDLMGRFIKSSRTLILENRPGTDSYPVVAHRVHEGGFVEPLQFSRQMLHEIMLHGRSFRTRDAAVDERWDPEDSIRGMGVHGAMGAPLFDNEVILGAVYMDSRCREVKYTDEDLRLLNLLGNMMAVKITNSRHERQAKIFEHFQSELALAERIQMNLLPRALPEIPGYEVSAYLHPCESVGGDLYDIRRLANGQIWITLGDVTGHGIPAAILMAHVMMGLRFLEERESDPLRLISQLENKLDRHIEDWQYVALFAAVLDPATGRLVYVNAGQWPPVILGAGKCSTLKATGVPVALLSGVQDRSLGECRIDPGGALVLFSDCIPETSREGRTYQGVRMREFISSIRERAGTLSAADIAEEFLDDVEAFRGQKPPADDLTLVVVKRV